MDLFCTFKGGSMNSYLVQVKCALMNRSRISEYVILMHYGDVPEV